MVAAAPVPTRFDEPSRAYVTGNLLLCSFLWASSLLFIKLSGETHPLAIAAIRGLIGAGSLAIWLSATRARLAPLRAEWLSWAVLGALNGWLPNVMTAYALARMATGPAAMIQASSPLIVAILAHFLFAEERLTRQRVAGAVLGFVGMGVLIGPAALPDSAVDGISALLMLGVATSYALANLYARFLREADPARLALGQQIFSGLPATFLALAFVGPGAFAVAQESFAPLIALGIFSTAIPILLFMRLIRAAGPTRASMVGYLMPVWAVSIGVAFLSESIGPREIAGGLVVLCGVVLVSLSRAGARSSREG